MFSVLVSQYPISYLHIWRYLNRTTFYHVFQCFGFLIPLLLSPHVKILPPSSIICSSALVALQISITIIFFPNWTKLHKISDHAYHCVAMQFLLLLLSPLAAGLVLLLSQNQQKGIQQKGVQLFVIFVINAPTPALTVALKRCPAEGDPALGDLTEGVQPTKFWPLSWIAIGDKTVTINANSMLLVHSIYYIDRALLALDVHCLLPSYHL